MLSLTHQALLSFITLFIAIHIAGSIPSSPLDVVCAQIQGKLASSSAIYFPGDSQYEKGISHFSLASTQQSKCVVEPGSEQDVAEVVKGGGHATNPGFSSTNGVHIYMTRFSQVTYQVLTETAEIGMGLIWDDVYAALEPFNRTVLGGRVSGIGVAGFSLGGGYSWKTNQYGLAIDTIEAFRLVKPDGSISTVTHASQPELFFALKGTQNNFGIVTKITMKTVPQGPVWGGIAFFDMSLLDQVAAATVAFHKNVRDRKAALISAFTMTMNTTLASVLIFYDGPSPPPGIFDSFTSLPSIMKDVKTRSYLSMVQSSPDSFVTNRRVYYEALPHPDITSEFIQAMINELLVSAPPLTMGNGSLVACVLESFLPNILQHTSLPSAYPATRTQVFLPSNIAAEWTDDTLDEDVHRTMKGMASRLRAAAISQGQNIPEDAPSYPNYALFDTPIEHIFGPNLPRLQNLKKKIDPMNVMGLAGGFKL
ncbi:hypothetical protein BJ165DRAFT_1417460 [Panaeolus papilionaceus]|nr:hypothetical protein BJ165DRAFT_1417460 [Panaeolus papilionaceus]